MSCGGECLSVTFTASGVVIVEVESVVCVERKRADTNNSFDKQSVLVPCAIKISCL